MHRNLFNLSIFLFTDNPRALTRLSITKQFDLELISWCFANTSYIFRFLPVSLKIGYVPSVGTNDFLLLLYRFMPFLLDRLDYSPRSNYTAVIYVQIGAPMTPNVALYKLVKTISKSQFVDRVSISFQKGDLISKLIVLFFLFPADISFMGS